MRSALECIGTEILIPHPSALIPHGPLSRWPGPVGTAGACSVLPLAHLVCDLAVALSRVSTSTGRIGSVTGHSATRPRVGHSSDAQPLTGSCRNDRRLLRSPGRIRAIDLTITLS